MPHVILYQPEIPPNTGNIIRLCANTGFQLHLIEPLGFSLDEKKVRRAGLDYSELAVVRRYPDLDACLAEINPHKVFALTTKGTHSYADVSFHANDALLFGPETRGLPADIRESLPPEQRLKLPMQPDSRSLNLSNAVAVMVYEVWRQLDFDGGA